MGYNGGVDEFGRQVLNPAGIDLADGEVLEALILGMTDNDWVDVTFNWEGGGKGAGVKAPFAPPLTPPPSPTPVPPTATPTPPSPWQLLKDGQTGESVRARCCCCWPRTSMKCPIMTSTGWARRTF